MAQINQNITMWAGDDITITTQVLDCTDTAVDLTSIESAQWVLKKYSEDVAILLTKTVGAGIAITDATTGTMVIVLEAADTQDIEPGDYYHELRIDNNSAITTVSTGKFVITATEDIG